LRLPDAFTTDPPGVVYDPAAQLNIVNGRTLVAQPEILNAWTTTWGTTDRDNKTDESGNEG
jgi:hypothetical protein